MHGKEIESFSKLFLATKEDYVEAGIDIHYETTVTSIDVGAKTIQVEGEGTVTWDRLVIASGFKYADPGVPGGELDGLYYMKNIREAEIWDKRLDTVKKAVVLEAGPLGAEMVSALAHRGIETHVVDPHPWALSEVADPDIVAPVEAAWREQMNPGRAAMLAHFYAAAGEAAKAVGWLRLSVNRGLGLAPLTTFDLKFQPQWDKIRAAPEFMELLANPPPTPTPIE